MKSSISIKYTLSIFLLIYSLNLFSQDRGSGRRGSGMGPGSKSVISIIGKIVDETSQVPLEYATISAFSKKDTLLMDGSISDAQGKFSLNVKSPFVFLKIEYLGYNTIMLSPEINKGQKLVGLDDISLRASAEVLEDIEIRAEKSQSQFFLDKQVFNVGKDLANKGGTAEEILDNVPSVTVDIDGVVSLRGNTGVRMLVDGKPSGLIGSNNNGLRTIPANMIESIEVVTNPSARYEAEGMAGIINIVLKKNKANGFNGSFDLVSGYPLKAGFGASVNYRQKNFNWFFNYGLNYREADGGGFSYQENAINDQLFITHVDRDILRKSISNNFRFGADYFLSDKEQITATFLFKKADENNLSTIQYDDFLFNESEPLELSRSERIEILTNEKRSSYSKRVDDEVEDEKNLEYSLNYTKTLSNKDHKINTLIQFTDRSEVEGSDLTDNTFNANDVLIIPLLQRSNNDEGNQTWLFQSDYEHALSKDKKWEAGVRASLRDIRNNYIVETNEENVWVPIDQFTNEFLYSENIYAAYSIFGNKINKFSYQFGLRAEYTDITTELLKSENTNNKRAFFGLFPSGHLNYSLSDVNAMQVSYSRRVRRPRFWDLNPFFTFMDNRNFFSGNPNVNPQYTNSFELRNINYWDNMSLTGAIFYRTTVASLERISFLNNDNNTTITVPLNLGDIKDIGVDLNFSHSGNKWLRLDANLSIFNNSIKIEQADLVRQIEDYFYNIRSFTGTAMDLANRYRFVVRDTENLTWNSSLSARLSFWDSSLQLRGNYRAANDAPQGRRGAVASLDLGWSKDLTKNLTLTFSGRDIFNSRKRKRTIAFEDYYSDLEFQWRSRSYTMTLNYRINQKKKRGGSGRDFEGGDGF